MATWIKFPADAVKRSKNTTLLDIPIKEAVVYSTHWASKGLDVIIVKGKKRTHPYMWLVVDSGTRKIPVLGGNVVKMEVKTLSQAKKDATEFMKKLLRSKRVKEIGEYEMATKKRRRNPYSKKRRKARARAIETLKKRRGTREKSPIALAGAKMKSILPSLRLSDYPTLESREDWLEEHEASVSMGWYEQQLYAKDLEDYERRRNPYSEAKLSKMSKAQLGEEIARMRPKVKLSAKKYSTTAKRIAEIKKLYEAGYSAKDFEGVRLYKGKKTTSKGRSAAKKRTTRKGAYPAGTKRKTIKLAYRKKHGWDWYESESIYCRYKMRLRP